MITWDQAQNICQSKTSDFSADSLTFFKMMMNYWYKWVLAELGVSTTQKVKTSVTVADQQYYQTSKDYLFMRAVTVTVGTTVYVLQEVNDQETWDLMNRNTVTSSIPTHCFIKPNFGFGNTEIGIYPIPSTADYTITMTYESSDKDLAVDKYTTGTLTATNGSSTIEGSGTTWTSAMIGRYIKVTAVTGDGWWYKIISRSANDEITIDNAYEGTTVSGVNYQISEAFNLKEDLQMIPINYALADYWAIKLNEKQEAKYLGLSDRALGQGKQRYKVKSRKDILRKPRFRRSDYPSYFPTNITE